ncbi:DEAD/DEAH box helicase [Vibrio sinensis]|uniref:DEAD/DEAH box helicase n=1 Tax=Vibrio sinensis TaxID=2302434 RepID=A0A3A6QFM8_9VIBR|nr:DEAD/DEAH box helicase [Vibrio sinensis]RJX68947.1 DEAD/DEAH box helicase [Vibrio sinensis]
MLFTELNLSSTLTREISLQFKSTTPVQASVIPVALNGKDVLAIAQTGSGKTWAYGLPILEQAQHTLKLANDSLDQENNRRSMLQALVLVPTRELAMQVNDALSSVTAAIGINSLTICGGVDKEQQIQQLLLNPEIIVATPGRLLDLLINEHIDASSLKTLVLDEADRLVDMGFWSDIEKILTYLPTSRQTLMFSATLVPELKSTIELILSNPVLIQTHATNSVVEDIEEILYLVNKGSKTNALIAQIKQHQWEQVLIFIGAKDNADALCKKLAKAGISAAALHGNKSQVEREETLLSFKQKQTQVLVATDLLARGIHIEKLPIVINMDLPTNPAVYVHRVGRTARAGETGLAISFVCHGENEYLDAIRKLTERTLPLELLEEFPVTDKPSTGESKRAPRDKQANRRTSKKSSIKQFKPKRQ